jgi:aryl-alcohol dehydrogenase-like predicted oxidoreductase
MMFGPWGNDDRADAVRVIHRALDAGINFVDTADVYSGGVSEEIAGEALRGHRDDVVLATNFFMPMDDRPNHGGGSRKWIMQEAENSLRRLKTDYIDLYQVHRPSATTDVEETLGALTDLVRQGKVRYIGSSSYSASQLADRPQAQGRPRYARVGCPSGCPIRHEHPGEPAQTECRRRACAARRAVRNDDDRTRAGMGDQPPGRHLGDHRPADHGTT